MNSGTGPVTSCTIPLMLISFLFVGGAAGYGIIFGFMMPKRQISAKDLFRAQVITGVLCFLGFFFMMLTVFFTGENFPFVCWLLEWNTTALASALKSEMLLTAILGVLVGGSCSLLIAVSGALFFRFAIAGIPTKP